MDIRYVAGFFDGEGCISTVWTRNYPNLAFNISQNKPEVLYEISSFFLLKDEYTGKDTQVYKNKHGQYILNVSGAKRIIPILKDLLPFLIVKREEAEVAIELGERIIQRKGIINKRITNDEYSIRIKLANKLTSLKGSYK